MSTWTFGLEDLSGNKLGPVTNAHDRRMTLLLNGVATAGFRISLDHPLANEITSRAGDVRLKVYQGTTLRFHGELTLAEEINHWYRRVISRENIVNLGYSLGDSVKVAYDAQSVAARGLYEEVVPSDVTDAGLRQALVNEHVSVRKNPREVVTFEPMTQEEPTLTCAFANPLWRLQKRMCLNADTNGTPATVTFTATDRAQIMKKLLDRANTLGETGVQGGTYATLYSSNAGEWNYKPVGEAFAEMAASGAYNFVTSTGAVASDPFTGMTGTLNGRVAPAGGTWSSSGNPSDWQGFGGTALERASSGDLARQLGILSSGPYAGAYLAQVDMNYSGDGNTHQGVVMRHSTSSKFVSATLDSYQGSTRTNYITFSRVAPVAGGTGIQVPAPSDLQAGISVFYTIRLQVAASGEWQIWFWETGGSPLSAPYMTGQDSTLATGGELDTGKVGLIDWNDGSTTSRLYDSFSADTLVEGTFGIQGLDFELVPIEFSSGKIATLNVYEALGSDKPNAVFENPAVAPVYGTDYVVGDTVRMRAKYNGVSRLNGTVRVYGIELTVDEEGKETVVPTLISES